MSDQLAFDWQIARAESFASLMWVPCPACGVTVMVSRSSVIELCDVCEQPVVETVAYL